MARVTYMVEYINKLMVFVSWAHASEIEILTGQKLIAYSYTYNL